MLPKSAPGGNIAAMSFDVYIQCPTCRVAGHVFNLTHNVNGIVDEILVCAGAGEAKTTDKAYGARSWGRLVGWTVDEVRPIISRAVGIANDPDREPAWRLKEPENKWGTLDSVREVLARFNERLLEAPSTSVIDANG